MNNKSLWIGLLSGIAGAILALVSFALVNKTKSNDKTAYIVTQELFDSFDGTKEIKKKVTKMEEKQKMMFDSLALDIDLLEKRFGSEDVKVLREKNKYNMLYAEVNQTTEQETQKFNDGLWQQINQYVGEYGKEKGYTFIYGASGNGSLMFADNQRNITEDVVAYINKKYAE